MTNTKTLDELLDAVLHDYGLSYGVAATTGGEVLSRRGDIGALRWKGLLDQLFGSPDAIVRLVGSLEGQILPQVYGQGDIRAAVLRPRGDLVVGLFGAATNAGGFYILADAVSKRLADELPR
jgi:hypothetical protein